MTDTVTDAAMLDDLRVRVMKATTEIDAAAMKATRPQERRRLEGKSEGVRLALSYLKEAGGT